MKTYGRADEDWERLVDAGLRFLREQARLERITTYTEVNATLSRRTGLPPFNFDLDAERAAMGRLLGDIVMRELPVSDVMISALVIYLNENDAGPGFYAFAKDLGRLQASATAADKFDFWIGEVTKAHDHYRHDITR